MMVPRSYVPISTAKQQRKSLDLDEKMSLLASRRLSEKAAAFEAGPSPPQSRSTSPHNPITPGNPRSDPVAIPSQRKGRPKLDSARPSPTASSLSQPSLLSTSAVRSQPRRNYSAHDLLTATTIPLRRRPKGRRLPAGDHVADFSRLMLDHVKPGSDGLLSSSLSNPNYDGLFGNLDELVEGQMFVGSEGVAASVLSTRSVSSESMPSLGSSDDFVTSDTFGLSPVQRNASERRLRQKTSSQGCDDDHPLLHTQPESPLASSPELDTPRNLSPARRSMRAKDGPSTFKSSLSASLRALRSAAQSVSNIASSPPIIRPDDFLHHSFFKIQPSLTDDKRPPPSPDLPSPELRRYLNPNTLPTPPDSPAQLHFWHEERSTRTSTAPRVPAKKSKQNAKSRSPSPPRSIPLQSCLPPPIRTANASAPPIWLSADGIPSNKRTAVHNLPPAPAGPGGSMKQREPRENPDFLRVLVAEMNMRRAGKFEADAAGRARMWVEARGAPTEQRRKAEDRWEVWMARDEEEDDNRTVLSLPLRA